MKSHYEFYAHQYGFSCTRAVNQKFIVQQEYCCKGCPKLSVKDRMADMLSKIEENGTTGIEMRELVKVFYEKWGFRLSTIKGYINDLEELELIKIVGTRVYHFSHQLPRGLVRSTR